jgi:hypothetical protein
MMPPDATTNPRRIVLAIVLAVCGSVNALVLVWIVARRPFLNADFLGFWAYPRFTPLLSIYDPMAMMRFQQNLYPGYKSFYPFTYPPDALLFCGWMRGLGYNAARACWLIAGLAVFAAAGLALFRGRVVPVLMLLASPAALLCIILGQSSFFIGAFLLGGFAALPRRPVLAGVLFGLLTLKPQMGLLLPLLLLARGEWRAIIAATLTAGLLVLLTCLALPPALWLLWLTSLPQIQHDYFAGGTNLNIMITPAANLLHLGAGSGLAMSMQGLCALAAAACVFAVARRGTYPAAVAVLLVAIFIAQPHAYAYDLVVLPAALLLGLPDRAWWLQALGLALYLAPLLLLSPWAGYFLYAPPLLLLLAAITWLARTPAPGAEVPHVPAHPAN